MPRRTRGRNVANKRNLRITARRRCFVTSWLWKQLFVTMSYQTSSSAVSTGGFTLQTSPCTGHLGQPANPRLRRLSWQCSAHTRTLSSSSLSSFLSGGRSSSFSVLLLFSFFFRSLISVIASLFRSARCTEFVVQRV